MARRDADAFSPPKRKRPAVHPGGASRWASGAGATFGLITYTGRRVLISPATRAVGLYRCLIPVCGFETSLNRRVRLRRSPPLRPRGAGAAPRPAGLLGLAISVPIGTFRLYRAAAVLRHASGRVPALAERLPAGFAGGRLRFGYPPGPRRPFVRAPPAVCRRHAAAFRLRKGRTEWDGR
jgi:hypothetical protein